MVVPGHALMIHHVLVILLMFCPALSAISLERVGDVPYVVAVLHRGKVCSGAVLEPSWILTAAHCVFDATNNSSSHLTVTIVAGSLNAYSNQQADESSRQSRLSDLVIIHPFYRSNWAENDIALIKLNENLALTIAVNKILLSDSAWGKSTKVCEISGYGRLQKGNASDLDFRLKTHRMAVTRPCPCEMELIKEKVRNWLCSKIERHSGPCSGDSGAPVVCGGRLWGLTSATFYIHDPDTCDLGGEPERPLCGTIHVLNVFMDIHPYSSWILQAVVSASCRAAACWPVLLVLLVLTIHFVFL